MTITSISSIPVMASPAELPSAKSRAKAALRKNFHLAHRMQMALKALSDFQIEPISPKMIQQVQGWEPLMKEACAKRQKPPQKWTESRDIITCITHDTLMDHNQRRPKLFAVHEDVCQGVIEAEDPLKQESHLYIYYFASAPNNILELTTRKRGAVSALIAEAARIALIYGKRSLLSTPAGSSNGFHSHLGFTRGPAATMHLPKDRFFELLRNLVPDKKPAKTSLAGKWCCFS